MGAPISHSAHRTPAGVLAGAVIAYDGYRERGVPPAEHLGLPSPYLTMIVTLDEPLELRFGTRRASFRTLIGGLHTDPVLITHDGAQSGIQLSISPLASRALFGVPAAELAALDLHGDEVIGTAAPELWEQLQESTSWGERFAILDRELSRRILAAGPVAWGSPALVSAAWARLNATGGAIAIAALAREVGWSERQLEKRFRAEIGVTPKLAGRMIRFDRARRSLGTAAGRLAAAPPLARVAADHGYHDQSHLIRDFRAFTGLAPTRWLAQEFGNVQAAGPAAA